MDVTGTPLLEKDIENLARGEAGTGLGTPRASPRGPRSLFICVLCKE